MKKKSRFYAAEQGVSPFGSERDAENYVVRDRETTLCGDIVAMFDAQYFSKEFVSRFTAQMNDEHKRIEAAKKQAIRGRETLNAIHLRRALRQTGVTDIRSRELADEYVKKNLRRKKP